MENIKSTIKNATSIELDLFVKYKLTEYDFMVEDEIISYIQSFSMHGDALIRLAYRINKKIVNVKTDRAYLLIIKKYQILEELSRGKNAKYRRIANSRLKYYSVNIRTDYRLSMDKILNDNTLSKDE